MHGHGDVSLTHRSSLPPLISQWSDAQLEAEYDKTTDLAAWNKDDLECTRDFVKYVWNTKRIFLLTRTWQLMKALFLRQASTLMTSKPSLRLVLSSQSQNILGLLMMISSILRYRSFIRIGSHYEASFSSWSLYIQ